MKLIRAYLACKGGVLPCSQKYTPHRVHCCLHTTNPQPKPFQPTSSPPMQRNTPQCGVTKQCVAKECGAKMWRHRKMWRHQTMCRQRMWRQNVASPGKCGVTKQCGAKQCGAKMWRHRKMWRHQTMWRQTMQRQNVASQENAASPNNVAPKKVAPHVFEMCLHNVSSASGGKSACSFANTVDQDFFCQQIKLQLIKTFIQIHRVFSLNSRCIGRMKCRRFSTQPGGEAIGNVGAE